MAEEEGFSLPAPLYPSLSPPLSLSPSLPPSLHRNHATCTRANSPKDIIAESRATMIDKLTYHRGVGEDLWKRVTAKGVMSQRFCLHLGKRVIDIRQKSSSLLKTEPSCLINRADLCSGSPIRNLSSPPLSISFSPLCMIPRRPDHYSHFAAPERPNQSSKVPSCSACVIQSAPI